VNDWKEEFLPGNKKEALRFAGAPLSGLIKNPYHLSKLCRFRDCDALANVPSLPGSRDRSRAPLSGDSDGPSTHVCAPLMAPDRQHSPMGPLTINLPSAEGDVWLE
jgi:hypothetical protein